MNISQVAHALNGEVVGQEVLCPGPGHSPHDRSLSVRLDARAPEGFLVFSFSGDTWQLCRDHVRARLHLAAPARAVEEHGAFSCPPDVVELPDCDRVARALALWGEADELAGSPGAMHFSRRGVDLGALPRELHRALRWHRACPWKRSRHPCMLALFSDAVTGEPRGIHRTAITSTGEKVGRMSLGPIKGCVIRLWSDEEVELGLVVGEGIETTLAAATRIEHKGTLLCPAWAAGFDGNMASLPVLGGIEALTLLVDHDKSGAGQFAADECSARWTAAGREVTRLVPSLVGTDFNDVVLVP